MCTFSVRIWEWKIITSRCLVVQFLMLSLLGRGTIHKITLTCRGQIQVAKLHVLRTSRHFATQKAFCTWLGAGMLLSSNLAVQMQVECSRQLLLNELRSSQKDLCMPIQTPSRKQVCLKEWCIHTAGFRIAVPMASWLPIPSVSYFRSVSFHTRRPFLFAEW